MKLTTAAVFAAGYVLGTRAGRHRYEQIRQLAGRWAEEFDGPSTRQRLESISSRLETYARERSLNSSADTQRARPPA